MNAVINLGAEKFFPLKSPVKLIRMSYATQIAPGG